jgi:hypothetical protein
VVLLGFAFGWALLAVLSVRFSDQPQRWAAAPAAFMGLAGLASLSGSAAVRDLLSWVWPPALLGLVVWIFLRVRGSCAAEAHGGCSTPFWPCWRSPPWAAATRPYANRLRPRPIRHPAS